MATLWDLAKRDGDWTELKKHLSDLETQVGSQPGEPTCDCNAEACRKRTLEEHLAGIERTTWSRCSFQTKSQVLCVLYPEESGIPYLRIAMLRLKEGENRFLQSWSETRGFLIRGKITTEAALLEADDWVHDIAGATFEAIFPWSVIEPKLRALP